MKSTGIVRYLDNLGRIVIPIELRRVYKLEKNDPVEIYVSGENIILRKYQPDVNPWTNAELNSALVQVCLATGKDPTTFLKAAREKAKEREDGT